MSWRYFKRIPIIPGLVSLNLSKRGASLSVGVPGLRLTIGRRGLHISAGIPGSGLSWRRRIR
ncbi:MAG TPA: DUF4236 domain-containing protein [Chloroflexi bacterium]|nr:DUF4236 domain-containing protein [Chloroflexota bacterium]